MENNGNVCEQCGSKLTIMGIYNSWTEETEECHACKTCSITTWGVSEKAFNLAKKYDTTDKESELGKIAKIIEWVLGVGHDYKCRWEEKPDLIEFTEEEEK